MVKKSEKYIIFINYQLIEGKKKVVFTFFSMDLSLREKYIFFTLIISRTVLFMDVFSYCIFLTCITTFYCFLGLREQQWVYPDTVANLSDLQNSL